MDYPVVYIQHDRTETGVFEKYAKDGENLDDLNIAFDDIWIAKYTNDVFTDQNLK